MSRFFYMVVLLFSIAALTIGSPASSSNLPSKKEDRQAAKNIISMIGRLRDITIMPLGASIVYGYRSSTGNGFRLDMIEGLGAALYPKVFTCVGNVRSGNTSHTAFSGSVAWPGRFIAQVEANMTEYFTQTSNICPDMTVIHAGTNDLSFNVNPPQAPTRLANLIDVFFDHCPDSSVFVAQIIRNKVTKTEKLIETFNAAIPAIVDERAQKGKKIMTVDMHSVVTANEMKDQTHPNDVGYAKMADKWVESMLEAEEKGWF